MMKGCKPLSIRSANFTKTQFELFPSKQWFYLCLGLHLLAIIVCLISAWFLPWCALGLPLIAFSYWWSEPTLIKGLQLQDDGHWQIKDGKGKAHLATLQDSSWLHPLACALLFKLQNGRILTCRILPDAMTKDDFRHLRIAIKLGQ